ncbi:MAG: hypothetical protein ACYSVY_16325, partial [Planctomycetota bacterium]
HLHVPCEGARLSLYRPLLMTGIDLTSAAVGHVHHFTRRQVCGYLESAGFAVTGRRYSMYFFGQLHDLITWWTMLRGDGRSVGEPMPIASDAPTTDCPTPRRFLMRHLLTRPAWSAIRWLLPRLQYVELAALCWQPLGSVGLCVTARRDD